MYERAQHLEVLNRTLPQPACLIVVALPFRAPSRARSRASSRPGTRGRRNALPLVAPVEKAQYSLKLTFEQDTSYLWLQTSVVEEKLSNEKLVDRHYSACKTPAVSCMYVCMYVCTYVCIFASKSKYMYVSMYICLRKNIPLHTLPFPLIWYNLP